MQKLTNYPLFITNYLLLILIPFSNYSRNITQAEAKVYIIYTRKSQRLWVSDTK